MHLTLPKRVIDKMTDADLELLGRTQWNARNLDSLTVSIASMNDDTLESVKSCLARIRDEGIKRAATLIGDINQWQQITATGGAGQKRASNMRRFADLLTEYVRTAPKHWVYQQSGGVWLAHYVNHIEYHPAHTSPGGWYNPACTTMDLLAWRLGSQTEGIIYRLGHLLAMPGPLSSRRPTFAASEDAQNRMPNGNHREEGEMPPTFEAEGG